MSGSLVGGSSPEISVILNQNDRTWETILYLNKSFAESVNEMIYTYDIIVPKKIGCNLDVRRAMSNNNTILTYDATNIVVDTGSAYEVNNDITATLDLFPSVSEIGCMYKYRITVTVPANLSACNLSICINGTLFLDCGSQTDDCSRFAPYIGYIGSEQSNVETTIVVEPTTTVQAQIIGYAANLRGAEIDGESVGDLSGYSVSLSSNGTVVAIGAPYNDGVNGTDTGHVRVYEWNGSTWVQRGDDIDGEAKDDQSGYSISLSNNGDIIAISAVYNDGENGADSGHVRVYEWNDSESNWVQRGSDIDGETKGEGSNVVSLSGEGTVVAIGATGNSGDGGNLFLSGSTRVYEWNGNSWVQRGEDIDGEGTWDFSGYSVSLSDDGSIVAIGAILNDGVNGSNSGHVRVYEWSGSSWVQRGDDIDGEASGDNSGGSVSLSNDGSIIAIGASYNDGNTGNSNDNRGHVRVYEWNGSSWVQRGDDIDGETAGDQSGSSVSLSNDGSIIAIGSIYNDGNTGNTDDNRGHVRVYEWNASSWELRVEIDGIEIGDQSGIGVSLSSDGSIVAIGANLNDGINGANSGHVRVYTIDPVYA